MLLVWAPFGVIPAWGVGVAATYMPVMGVLLLALLPVARPPRPWVGAARRPRPSPARLRLAVAPAAPGPGAGRLPLASALLTPLLDLAAALLPLAERGLAVSPSSAGDMRVVRAFPTIDLGAKVFDPSETEA